MKLNYDELIEQKTIYLEYEGLKDNDLDVLYQVIEQSTVLEKLDLGHNNLTLADGKLANAIANNTTLKKLYIYKNNIGPEGIKLLADALKKNNTTLEELYLFENNIGDEGAKYIAEMLTVNKTLQIIGLSSNNIGDQGAQSLATSLLENTGIRKVYLLSNNIGNKGTKKLADALESNHNIETIDLCGNNINNHQMKRLKDILDEPKRKEIVTLKLSIAKKDKELKSKDTEIELLKKESTKKDRDLAKKDKRIISFETAIRGQVQQFESILDPVDLTSEDESAEPANKRARTQEDTPKSTLAIQHKSIKEAVKVKEENINEYVDFLWAKLPRLRAAFVSFDEFVSATAMANMS